MNATLDPKKLISGATGDWEVVTLSRRKPDVEGAYEHIAIDLLDAAQCQAKLAHLSDVTHIFYVAVATNPDPLSPAIINNNLAMLRNLVENIEPVAAGLKHIHVMQGTKWYGSHLGGFKTPAREAQASSACSEVASRGMPRDSRTLFSISCANSGFSRRNSRALSRPWPIFSPL